MRRSTILALIGLAGASFAAGVSDAVERGRKHLLGDNYIPAIWSRDAYDNAWKRWEGMTGKPADYSASFRETNGLPPAPYPNNGLPMGLREGPRLLGKGVGIDCLACH